MLEKVDIRFIGVIGIIILLAIGYLVYVMYQDLVSVKKDLLEIQYNCVDLKEYDEEQSEANTEEYENYEGEIESNLESFIGNSPIEFVFDNQCEIQDSDPRITEVQIQEPEQEVKQKTPRKYKKKEKKLEPIQEQVELEQEALCEH